MKLYVAFVVQSGDRGLQKVGRIILDDVAMPVFADDMKRIEDDIERRVGSDYGHNVSAFITFMYQLED